MTERPSLFFDLDGTLTDPKPGITGCIRHALAEMGRPVPSADELEWCIGPPLLASFVQLVGAQDAATGVALYRERFSDTGLYENAVYPGIEGVLEEARLRGSDLYVASSKPHVFVERILEHFGLRRYFGAVFGSELDGTRGDKVQLLRHALAESGVSGQGVVMIGDRGVDADGARENAMHFVGVLYGYGSVAELSAAGATRWVHQPGELIPIVFGTEA